MHEPDRFYEALQSVQVFLSDKLLAARSLTAAPWHSKTPSPEIVRTGRPEAGFEAYGRTARAAVRGYVSTWTCAGKKKNLLVNNIFSGLMAPIHTTSESKEVVLWFAPELSILILPRPPERLSSIILIWRSGSDAASCRARMRLLYFSLYLGRTLTSCLIRPDIIVVSVDKKYPSMRMTRMNMRTVASLARLATLSGSLSISAITIWFSTSSCTMSSLYSSGLPPGCSGGKNNDMDCFPVFGSRSFHIRNVARCILSASMADQRSIRNFGI